MTPKNIYSITPEGMCLTIAERQINHDNPTDRYSSYVQLADTTSIKVAMRAYEAMWSVVVDNPSEINVSAETHNKVSFELFMAIAGGKSRAFETNQRLSQEQLRTAEYLLNNLFSEKFKSTGAVKLYPTQLTFSHPTDSKALVQQVAKMDARLIAERCDPQGITTLKAFLDTHIMRIMDSTHMPELLTQLVFFKMTEGDIRKELHALTPRQIKAFILPAIDDIVDAYLEAGYDFIVDQEYKDVMADMYLMYIVEEFKLVLQSMGMPINKTPIGEYKPQV